MKYKTGDILVGKGTEEERKILGVCDLVAFVSQYGDFKRASEDYYTEQELDEYFTLKSSEWKPKIVDTYWCISHFGMIESSIWYGTEYDKFRLATKNYFRTREEAEARLSEIKKEAGLI